MSRGTAIITLLSFSTPKLDASKFILTHDVCQRFAIDYGFSCRPWIWADSISFEEHLKSHQTKKQDSQVVAPAGFSDIIDTTHRLLLCHGTFYWFAIQYRYIGLHYLYLRLEGSLFRSEGDRVLFQRLICIFSPCHDFSALTGFSFRC